MPDLLAECALTSRSDAIVLFSALQQRAGAAGIKLRTPPSEPATCCGRGCNGCVWEGYYSAVDYWREEALLQLQACRSALPTLMPIPDLAIHRGSMP